MEVFNKIVGTEPAAQRSGLMFKFKATDQVLWPEEWGYATLPVTIASRFAFPVRVR